MTAPLAAAREPAPRNDPVPVPLRSSDRVMVVAPHPDDESLATAGLLLRAREAGAAVRIVYVTAGDRNPWAQLVVEGRWPTTPEDRARWGRRRRQEALAALTVLGLPPGCAGFLGLPDQGVTRALLAAPETLTAPLVAELNAWRPTVVAAPSLHDHHPDHSAVGVGLQLALRRSRRMPIVLHYLVHGHGDGGSRWVMLDEAERARKRESILCHASQLRWRRRELLDYATERERFLGAVPVPVLDPSHPIREAELRGRTLRARLDLGRGLRLGRPVLHVLLDGAEHGVVTLTLRVPPGPRLALAVPDSPGPCFMKLSWGAELRLGFFDRWGWRPVPVAVRTPVDRPVARKTPLRADRESNEPVHVAGAVGSSSA